MRLRRGKGRGRVQGETRFKLDNIEFPSGIYGSSALSTWGHLPLNAHYYFVSPQAHNCICVCILQCSRWSAQPIHDAKGKSFVELNSMYWYKYFARTTE